MTYFLGLGGYAGAGKDAFADILVESPEWRKRRMSEPFEVGLLATDPWIDVPADMAAEMHLGTMVRYSVIHAAIGYERSKKIPEVRRFTQHFATEAGRDIHGEHCWTEIARRSCQKDRAEGFNVALTGTRFFEEIKMVREEGGITVWVERPGYGPVNAHASDNTLGPKDFDVVVDNSGDLVELGRQIAIVLKYIDILPLPHQLELHRGFVPLICGPWPAE